MNREDFLNKLKDDIILFDGAMGTMIYAKGIYINRCYDELNISNPGLIKEIHLEYIKAGALCIETNTFGANVFKLQMHGFADIVDKINFSGAKIAREVAGDNILVAGSIGPLGVRVVPLGTIPVHEAFKAFKMQAEALLKGGVDLFILETFSDLISLKQAVLAIRQVCDYPIIASMTIGDDGTTFFGTSPQTFGRELNKWDIDAVGLNCSVGPRIMLEAMEELRQVSKKYISVMPNAGYPENVDGRNLYLASSEYMAEYARRFIQSGARIVGGCCGTTPDYIRAIKKMIRSLIHHEPTVNIEVTSPKIEESVQSVPLENKSNLGNKIANKKFVTAVEIVPPRGCDPQKVLSAVTHLKDNHIDVVNIPDGPRALSRMSAQHLGILIQQTLGMEVILHYTCRDRNLLGMMSDMLGLDAVGIKNLLIITGDPPKMGDYPDATAVFDIDSIGLVNMVNRLNHGLDIGGNKIGKPTGYVIGIGVNPGATDWQNEISRFEQKVKGGADYAITQPIFDVSMLSSFLQRIENQKVPIFTGIWPLVSLRNAEFMNNEIPGASVPPEIMKRMRDAKTKEDALKEGIKIAQETINAVKDKVNGIQLSAPLGRLDLVLDVLSVLRA